MHPSTVQVLLGVRPAESGRLSSPENRPEGPDVEQTSDIRAIPGAEPGNSAAPVSGAASRPGLRLQFRERANGSFPATIDQACEISRTRSARASTR